jgi:hypothetical protein
LSPVSGSSAGRELLLRLEGDLRFFSAEYERTLAVRGAPSLKHLLEGAGIPHPEVDWLRVDGFPASLDDSAHAGTLVEAGTHIRTQPDGEPWRFILDCHLGRLSKHLRLLGFDTIYATRAPDEWLARGSALDNRWLLTRDKGLLFRSSIVRGYLVRSPQPREQLAELLARHTCITGAQPLSRCLVCNYELAPEALDKALAEAPPKTRLWCREFYRCPGCARLYWKGSHFDRLMGLVRTHLPAVPD